MHGPATMTSPNSQRHSNYHLELEDETRGVSYAEHLNKNDAGCASAQQMTTDAFTYADVVPARTLLTVHDRAQERKLPAHARNERMNLVAPYLMCAAAAASHAALETACVHYTVRVYSDVSSITIAGYTLTFQDGYAFVMPIGDLVAWLRSRAEFQEYTIDDSLVGISFTATRGDRR